MLSFGQDMLLVALIVVSSLGLLALVYRFWALSWRATHNDIIGWQLSVLGTVYAVILGFMLYTVWSNFGIAEVNADAEAGALMNVYRLADAIPQPQSTQLHQAAKDYINIVINDDWPTMAAGPVRHLKSHDATQRMWDILLSVQNTNPAQATAVDHAMSELSDMSTHRRIREVESGGKLPGVLWFVLVAGAMLTIGSSCLFACTRVQLHAMQVFAFSLLVALVLIAIADIDRPFQGAVHVSDDAFVRARGYIVEFR